MKSSIALFDALAADYDTHFEAAHRRAYDELAWEFVQPLLPASAGCVIDAGCGVGRWADRLLRLGHSVIGIEQAPAMAAQARARLRSERFTLIEGPMEEVELPEGAADLVLALGSLQYSGDPEWMIGRLAGWVRVGGWVVVLVDSLVALVLELMAAGKQAEALHRLGTRQGTWIQGDLQADHHLLDRQRLECAMRDARLDEVSVRGLLVGMSAFGREELLRRLEDDWRRQMALERELAGQPLFTDLGKQLLACGRRAR